LELVALKAAIEQVQQEYAFSERRACGLMTMAVTTYVTGRCEQMSRCGRSW